MSAPPGPGVDHAAFVAGFKKLSAAFPGSFPDEAATEAKMRLWRELLDGHAWVTRQVFARGVLLVAWTHAGDFLPPPAIALDYFREAERVLDREARAQQAQLPAPAPPTEQERLEADARAEAAKGAARAKLPPRMRATSPKRKEAWW